MRYHAHEHAIRYYYNILLMIPSSGSPNKLTENAPLSCMRKFINDFIHHNYTQNTYGNI